MSDNSAGSPANTQPGPEVAVPDEASQSQVSVKQAVPSEEVSDNTESQAPVAVAEGDVAAPQVQGLAPPATAAARQVAVRPRIGDTRPAPPPPVSAEPTAQNAPPAEVVGLRSPAKSRQSTQGQRKQGRQTPSKQAAQEAAGPKAAGTKGLGPRPDLDVAAADDELDGGNGESPSATKGRRRSGRERRGKPVGRYLMCVHVRPHATQIAVLEGRTLVEHFVSRASDDTSQIDGNIYLGRVQNVLPGMEAAFVDIATPKNAVLYRGDVRYDLEDVETRNSSRCGSNRC